MSVDQAQLIAYRERWAAVAEIEAAEQRETTVAQRWQKLNSILRMAAGLGIAAQKDDEQIAVVRQRWNFLKDRYLAEK